jgi:GNAT superfamily N-acetyltransferase
MCTPALLRPTSRGATDTASVCRSLTRAFIDDPFYRAVTIDYEGDEPRRQHVLTRYFELAIEEGTGLGEVQFGGTDGAAIWITYEASAAEIAKHGAAKSTGLGALLGTRGYANYVEICEAMAERVPTELTEAWYLSILGVQPAARGRRLAQRLINATLSRADQLGATSFLETFNPLSIPFYERLGFRREKACFEAVTARPYWILARPAA